MKKIKQGFFLTLETVFRFGYLLVALALIAFLVLLFGHPILGPGLPGSDNPNFITLASWFSKWFPRVPFWYPKQGGGVSISTFYPILNHLVVVIFSKLSQFPITIATRIWGMVSVFLTSLGIYALGVRITKSQTVATLAALFYPLSPFAWIFLLEWGFFAEHAAYYFAPPVLVFLTLYLDDVLQERQSTKTRLYLLLSAAFFVISLLAHPNTFAGLIMLIVPLFVFYPLLIRSSLPKRRLLTKSLSLGLTVFTLAVLLALFWLVPFVRYQIAVKEGAATGKFVHSKELILQNSVYPINFFNLSTEFASYKGIDDTLQPRTGAGWRNACFPFAISLFALIGFIGAFFLNRKLFALGLANLFPLGVGLTPHMVFFLHKTPFLTYFSSWRALLLPSRFIIPLLAGFGCFTIGYLLASPLKFLVSKTRQKLLKSSLAGFFPLFSAILTLLVAGGGLYYFKNWPNNPEHLISYGAEISSKGRIFNTRDVWRRQVDVCLSKGIVLDSQLLPACFNEKLQEYFWPYALNQACIEIKAKYDKIPGELDALCAENPSLEAAVKVFAQCERNEIGPLFEKICGARVISFWQQLSPENWPSLTKDEEGAKEIVGDIRIAEVVNRVFGYLPANEKTRVDFAPALGGLLMLEPYYSQMPELPVYYNQSSLIPLMWNYEISSFYSKETVWPQPQIIDGLAKYFGLEYVFLSENRAPLERYRPESWERVAGVDTFGNLGLWRFRQPTGLLTATTKPLVLVVGQHKLEVFFRHFHLANIGGLSFDEAILVDGEDSLDSHSLYELKKFDTIILDGYTYKNRNKAWRILEEYVKSGGSLYINTGWQFSSADWELEETPEFFPFTKLEWTNAGKTKNFVLEEEKIGGGLNAEEFSPLIFGDSAWGISSSSRDNLRSWARVIASAQGKPLVAGGDYGSGRVVWAGLDLAGHIGAYEDNPEEVKFFHSLLGYLLEAKAGRDLQADFVRNYTDKVTFVFLEPSDTKTVLYWKEAYHRDFKAELIENGKSQKLPTYKAGPGLTLIVVPEVNPGTSVILEHRSSLIDRFARIISFTTLVFLILYIFRPQWTVKLKDLCFQKIKASKKSLARRLIGNMKDGDIYY